MIENFTAVKASIAFFFILFFLVAFKINFIKEKNKEDEENRVANQQNFWIFTLFFIVFPVFIFRKAIMERIGGDAGNNEVMIL